MSDDESYKETSSDAEYHYTTIISQAHVYEQEARDKAGQDPASSPSRFRASAIISRGLNEELFGPTGDLNSQIGSLAWVEAKGYDLPEGDEREWSASQEDHNQNPGSPFRMIKTEETEIELLRLRCADLETENKRLHDELARLRVAFDTVQAQANQWERLTGSVAGCIRKAMLQLNDAAQILGE